MSTPSVNFVPLGITVFCDPTLQPAMRSLDRISRLQTAAPLSVLSAPAMSMLAQIQRIAQWLQAWAIIIIPAKLGFKNPEFVTAIYVTNRKPGGFWVDRGYNWFSGI